LFVLGLLCAQLAGAAIAAPTVGDHARLFSLPAVNEAEARVLVQRERVGLADFVGLDPVHPAQVVVLFFFNRSLGAEHLGGLARLQRRHGDRGLQTLGVFSAADDLGDVAAWIEAQGLGFPVVRDHHGIVKSRYGLPKLPMIIVVDGQGSLHAVGLPGEAELEAELEPMIEDLLD